MKTVNSAMVLPGITTRGRSLINIMKNRIFSPLCSGVILADFHNVGMTPDINNELNKCAKGVDSSYAVYFPSVFS